MVHLIALLNEYYHFIKTNAVYETLMCVLRAAARCRIRMGVRMLEGKGPIVIRVERRPKGGIALRQIGLKGPDGG